MLAYLQGWKTTWNNKRLLGIWYVFTFCLALLTAIPFSGFLSKTIGNSLAANELLNEFNYTIISDFLNEYGKGLFPIFNQSIGMLLLFFVGAIFLMGGVLNVFKNQGIHYRAANFWEGSAKYFWRLLRLSIYFLLIHTALLLVFVLILFAQAEGFNPFKAQSEMVFINAIRYVGVIYLFFAVIVAMIHDYAKIHVIHQEIFLMTRPIVETLGLVFKNFIPFFFLFLLNLLTLALFVWLYTIISNKIPNETIWLAFLIGQLFVLLRITLKLVNLAGAFYLYQQKIFEEPEFIA